MRSIDLATRRDIQEAILSDVQGVIGVVKDTYVAHRNGKTSNPDSLFLRFPGKPNNRIIALPAHVERANGRSIAGIKWIASFPSNIESGIPRASGVIVLNDPCTGFPRACLEGSIISAARTAASAVLAADRLSCGRRSDRSVGVVGCGLIGRYILDFLLATGWSFSELHAHDQVSAYSETFLQRFGSSCHGNTHSHCTPDAVIERSDLVILTTTASTPHIRNRDVLNHNPLVLHISLRDLAPELILASHNVVDDVEHCLKGGTSVHLAEQLTGNREFVQFTLPEILDGGVVPDRGRPVVFSPFGMGILDVALAENVFEKLSSAGKLITVQDFF